LEEDLAHPPAALHSRFALLQRARDQAATIGTALPDDAGNELREWSQVLERPCREHSEDVLFLAPWLAESSVRASSPPAHYLAHKTLPAPPVVVEQLARLEQSPTLRDVSELDQSLCPLIE